MLLREAAHELVHAEQFAKAVARHGVVLLPRIEDWQVHPAGIFADTGIVGHNIPQSIQSEIGTQMASGWASALRVLRRSVFCVSPPCFASALRVLRQPSVFCVSPPCFASLRVYCGMQPHTPQKPGSLANRCRTPLPVFRKLNEVGSHGIPFDVSHHRQQMSVGLDRKRFETPLIQMSGTAGLAMSVPTHRVHNRQATEELAHLIAGFRSDDKVPVIGHRHHGINWQRHDFPCLCDHMHERSVVFRLFKNRQPSHRSVQNVEHFT